MILYTAKTNILFFSLTFCTYSSKAFSSAVKMMMAVNRKSAGPGDDKQSLIDEAEHEGKNLVEPQTSHFPD